MGEVPDWLVLSLGYVLVMGVNSVVSKVAMRRIELSQILVLTGVVYGAAGLATYLVTRPRFEWGTGTLLGTVAVTLALISLVLLFSAVSKGEVSRVVPIMSLYPLVAVVLSVVFLGERINPLHALGIVFGLVAVILLRLG